MTNRKINVEKLNDKQLQQAIDKVSELVNQEVAQVCDNVNKLLKRYGLKCKMQIVFEEDS